MDIVHVIIILIYYATSSCHEFHFQNDLKQGDASRPLLLNAALEYAIRNV
jgi:hypothetical protein